MKKRKISRILITIVICCHIVIYACKSNNSVRDIYTPRLIATQLKNKISYYDLLLDSSKKEIFKSNLANVINEIDSIEGTIEVVGDRSIIAGDSIAIEAFIGYKNKNEQNLAFIRSVNGHIEKMNIATTYNFFDIASFCNEHYFYLPKSMYPKYGFNSYSISLIKDEHRNAKVFLSDKFDSFNNTKCNCDSEEIEQILAYINGVFDSLRSSQSSSKASGNP